MLKYKRIAMAACSAALAASALGISTGQANAQEPGIYRFYNVGVEENLDGGRNPVYTHTPHEGEWQQWEAIPGAEGGLLVKNVYSGQCLEAPHQVGEFVTLETCNSANPNQNWRWGDNPTHVCLAWSPQECLEATGSDGPVRLAAQSPIDRQLWIVTKVQ